MEPFKLLPAFKDYIWGGTRLKTDFYKNSDATVIAESWELSAHEDGQSIIADGTLAGMPFGKFTADYPQLLGSRTLSQSGFPILIKLIDAQQALSVQVHPDDDYAFRNEGGPGKTEMWIVLDCKPDAYLYLGFNREVSAAEFRSRISDNTVTDILRRVPVKAGDVFYIAAGTVHAIGAGILLAEIQQNSNATYRVYDYGRVGADGKPRPLHINKALDVAKLHPCTAACPGAQPPVVQSGYTAEQLVSSPYFTVSRLRLNAGHFTIPVSGDSFVSILCVDGAAELECRRCRMHVSKGDSIFVPCGTGSGLHGTGVFLITTV